MKSTGVAYLLWLFLGGIGAHRFYLGRTGSGFAYVCLFVLTILTGGIMGIALGAWVLLDLFLIPGMVRTCNSQFGASATASAVSASTTTVNVVMPGAETPAEK